MQSEKGDATVTIIEPTRYPEKLSSLFYAVSLVNIVILVVDEINTTFGESVLLLQCAEKTHGHLILKNYLTIERIAPLIKGAVLEHYEVLEEDMIGLRKKLLDTAVRFTSRQKAKDTGGNSAVPVDHYFNVRGVGVVVLGCVAQGVTRKHDILTVLPTQKNSSGSFNPEA